MDGSTSPTPTHCHHLSTRVSVLNSFNIFSTYNCCIYVCDSFYRAILRRAWYCYGKLSVCDGEVSWSHRLEIFEKISRLVSLGCSLFADPNITNLLQGEHPEIFDWNGGWIGYGKNGFWHTKALISLKHSKIALRLLLRPIGIPICEFDWCQKSMTLDDL